MALRFLADESCDGRILCALRSSGHDVFAVGEMCPGISDSEVIRRATGEGHGGVLLLRYPFPLALRISEELVRLVNARGAVLDKAFVVLQPGRVRIFPTT